MYSTVRYTISDMMIWFSDEILMNVTLNILLYYSIGYSVNSSNSFADLLFICMSRINFKQLFIFGEETPTKVNKARRFSFLF